MIFLAYDPIIKKLFEKQDEDYCKKKCLSTSSRNCSFCQKTGHSIHIYIVFENKSASEKNNFIKKENLCYGCLFSDHMSNKCMNRRKCKERHPTSIHGLYKELNGEKTKSKNEEISSTSHVESVATALKAKNTKFEKHAFTMVVPVYISTNDDQHNEVLSYALLDTQSDTTFILDEVADDLVMSNYEEVQLELTTMSSTEYNNLRIRCMASSTYIALPPTYSRSHIPGEYSQIGTKKTAQKCKHLNNIQDKMHYLQKHCKFALLIGCNCAIALAPIKTIASAMPFAQETLLGWSIVGNASKNVPIHNTHRTCFVSQTKNDFFKIAKLLESDFIDTKRDNNVMSQNDILFMKTIEQTICQNEDGFYQMNLPFIKEPNLPNNKFAVMKGLTYLKHRLLKNQPYYHDYKNFMDTIIVQGDAEEVPTNVLHNNHIWYIPHHGLYHPRKPEKLELFLTAR